MLCNLFCQKQNTGGVLAIYLQTGPKDGEVVNFASYFGYVHGVPLLNSYQTTSKRLVL